MSMNAHLATRNALGLQAKIDPTRIDNVLLGLVV